MKTAIVYTDAFIGPYHEFDKTNGKFIGGAEIYLDYFIKYVLETNFDEIIVFQKNKINLELSKKTRIYDFTQIAQSYNKKYELLIINGLLLIKNFEFFPTAKKTIAIHHGMVIEPSMLDMDIFKFRLSEKKPRNLSACVEFLNFVSNNIRRRSKTVSDLNDYTEIVDSVVSVDDDSLKYVNKTNRRKWNVILNFVDTDIFNGGVMKVTDFNNEQIKILVPRNLSYGRGTFILPELVNYIKKRGITGFRFLVTGTGILQPFLEFEIKKNRLEAYISLLGHQDHIKNMPSLFAACDIVLVPTLCNEGTSISVLEAMAMKKPVVTTDTGGLKDIGKNGLHKFSSGFNVNKIGDNMIKLISDRKLRQFIGQNGYDYVISNHNLEIWISKWEKRLQSLLQ